MKSSDLYQRSLKVSPGGVHSPVRAFKSVGGNPLFFKAAEGAYIESVEGKKYIDFCQSFGPNILGHRDSDVQKTVEEMIHTAWSLGACEPYSLELAEWIQERVPWAEKIRFVSSGTEAVMSALRVARAATGRSLVLKFEGCYHGHVDSMLVKAGSGLAGETASDSAGVSEALAKTTLMAPLDDDLALEKVFATYGSQMACVILEPLPANFGLLIQRKEFLQKVVDLAKKNGALVLFDEVISGFRVALGGMAEQLDIQPDLVTYGKVIGGGFPVGAYAGRSDLMSQVAPLGPVYQAGTLSANPVGMGAGLATLKKVVAQNIYSELEGRTKTFCEGLKKKWAAEDLPYDITYMSSLFWLHPKSPQIMRSPKHFLPDQTQIFAKIFHTCLEQGLFLAPSAYEVGFISWAHTPEVLETAQDILLQSVRRAYGR